MPRESISIPLNSPKYPGHATVIDAEDAELAARYRWGLFKSNDRFYAAARERVAPGVYRRIYLHVLIAGVEKPDHKDGDGFNNRRSNLRPATQRQNLYNAPARKDSRSGFKGVAWLTRDERWTVRIKGVQRIFLGTYDDPSEAAKMYDAAAVLLHGEFARTNYDTIDPVALIAVVAIFRSRGMAY